MWIALIISDQLFLIIMSFLLFRFFDITKFLGINKIEKLNGSLGIMLDDIVAGTYTLIIVFFIKIFLLFMAEREPLILILLKLPIKAAELILYVIGLVAHLPFYCYLALMKVNHIL